MPARISPLMIDALYLSFPGELEPELPQYCNLARNIPSRGT
jgi:hypothetical protein